MNRVKIVKGIIRGYFFAALAVSFLHIAEAAQKLGISGWQSWSCPFIVDGIAVIGLIMRGEAFSAQTRRTGFWVQVGAGSVSLAANVYAGHNGGEALYGVAIVAVFLLAEWLGDKLESVQVDVDRATATKRSEAAKKAAATRAAKKVPAKLTRRLKAV